MLPCIIRIILIIPIVAITNSIDNSFHYLILFSLQSQTKLSFISISKKSDPVKSKVKRVYDNVPMNASHTQQQYNDSATFNYG